MLATRSLRAQPAHRLLKQASHLADIISEDRGLLGAQLTGDYSSVHDVDSFKPCGTSSKSEKHLRFSQHLLYSASLLLISGGPRALCLQLCRFTGPPLAVKVIAAKF